MDTVCMKVQSESNNIISILSMTSLIAILTLDQVLVERVRQTAWEMHYAKTDSIIYLFR